MSTSVVNVPSLNALFKEVYAEEVANLIPERELLTKGIPFVSSDKQNGGDFVVPVILSRDHGVSYLGSNSNNLQLLPPVAANVNRASLRASAMLMRGLMDYTSASRAQKGGPAFIDGTSYLVESITDSFAAVIEQTNFYGGKGLASFTAATGPLAASQIVADIGAWAPAVWVGAEGMPIEIFSDNAGLPGTVKVLITSISTVDITARTFTLASVAGLVAGTVYHIFRKGAKGLEALGIDAILSETSSLFGIDVVANGLFKANQYDAKSAPLSYSKVSEAISIAYGRGLEGTIDLHVNSRVFQSLIPDFLTAKDQLITGSTGSVPAGSNQGNRQGRTFTSAAEITQLEHGTKAIRFTINSVTVNVIANDYVKIGKAFGLASGTWLRIGSSEATFDLPDVEGGNYFRQVSDMAALELRMFSDQAPICTKPARNIVFSNITLV